MRASLLTLVVTLAAVQLFPPPPAGPPPPPQLGQVTGTPATQPPPLNAAECKCSIEVTVKRPNGEPLSDIEVSATFAIVRQLQVTAAGVTQLAPIPAGTVTPEPLTATTDSAGHAEFRNLAEGNYTIAAKRDGYFGATNDAFPTQASAGVPVGPAAPQAVARPTPLPGVIVVPPKQPVQQITLNMVKGSTVAGRIQDANRRPASGIQVGAFRVAYQNGHRVLNQAANLVMSDDRGDYRLFWLPPGEYYIRAGGTRASTIAGGTSYPTSVYYPGTSDPKSASPIVAREGSDLTGIDIGIQSSTGVTVSGTIVNTIPGGRVGPQGQVSRSVSSVFLVPRNSVFFENPPLLPNIGGAARSARGGAVNDSESAFEIRGVPPGTYDFYPVYNDGSNPAGGALAAYYTARTPIEVGSENVTGIQSVIKPGTNLKVHVTVTGTAPAGGRGQAAQPITLTNLRVQIQPKENIPSLARGGLSLLPALDADGTFTLPNLVDGQFFISAVTPMPVDAYVSEIRLDARSVFDDNIISIGKGADENLEVTVTRGGATIQGTVQDAKKNPVAARITLVPDMPRRGNALLYKTATSSGTGTFTLNGVAPGNYKLFAWEQNPAGAEQDADFIRDYDVLGTSVNVSAGMALTNIQVTLIPARH